MVVVPEDRPRIELDRTRLVVVTFGLLLSMVLSALDSSIVATAMPRIIADLSGLEYYAWVTTAYLVTSTTIIPISGKLGDMFGRKNFLQVGTIGFLAASALCGIAPSMPLLVVARAVQGVFGGFLTSSAFATTADLFLPATRAKIQGVFASMFAIAAIAGPILGGILTDTLGWRWVFYVNIPFGIVAFTIVALTMPRIRTHGTLRQVDVRGAVLLTAGIVPLLSALSETRAGGSAAIVAVLFALAAVMLAAFVWVELRVEHPIMPLRIFKIPTVAVAILVSFLSAFGMFGANIFIPLIYQGLLGMSATESGFYLTPRMIAMVPASLISGQIVSRVTHYRFVSAFGLGMLTIGMFSLSRVTPATDPRDVMRDLVFIGIGFGSNQPIYQNAVMSAVPFDLVGVAASQVQFWRQLGQTMGVAVLGAILAFDVGSAGVSGDIVLTNIAVSPVALTTGLQHLFLVAAIVCGACVLIALALKEVPFRGRQARTVPGMGAASAGIAGDGE